MKIQLDSDVIQGILTPLFEELEAGFRPKCVHEGDAGADIRAYIPKTHSKSDTKRSLLFLLEEDSMFGSEKDGFFLNGKIMQAISIDEAVKSIEEATTTHQYVIIPPFTTALISGGFKIALPILPRPFVAEYQIRSRSGLGIKAHLNVINRPGTVDSNYRKEVMVGLHNESSYLHIITHGSRIAQGVYGVAIDQSLYSDEEVLVDSMEDSLRGGFGSSGI